MRDTFIKRSKIVAKIREYMMNDGFMEVETPMMHPIPGGAADHSLLITMRLISISTCVLLLNYI